MALTPGTRIGSYDIAAQIGVGGMGEVYRATDTNLKRQVAIKVLPETLAADAERLARFQREAEVLAALNHPNIAAIYGLERSPSMGPEGPGQTALVMELVEGPTLADRIAQGPVPVDEALAIAKQIAEALEAAHEQGIIHRDLKPANIKLRPDGTVKVLDFGLAKAMEPASALSASAGQAGTISPTITTPAMTQAGLILGTAAYMSPEQAKGRPADRRSDVWAFGAVLYEMLSGKRAFGGEELSETLADVMRVEPAWSALPDGLSPTLVAYLRRCLAKDPRQRVHDIADVRLALEGAFEVAVPTPATQVVAARGRSPLAWVIAAAVLAAIGASVGTWTLTRPGPQPITRFTHTLGGESFTRNGRPVLAISRDGRRLVYVADSQLYLRSLDDPQARPIQGTDENPSSPAFSPDGEWVAFWSSEDSLKKILVTGGTPVHLTDAENPSGVSWELDGTIVYGQADGVWRVSESGGVPEQLVAAADGERIHGPQLLPGGNALLFASTTEGGTAGWEAADVVVQTIETGERTVLASGGAFPKYVPSGHVVYALGNTLLAQPFDPAARTVSRGPVPVVPGVMRAPSSDIGIAQFAFSDNGVLVYAPGAGERIETALALIDRDGNSHVLPNSSGLFSLDPRFSPDGTRIAVHRADVNATRNVWIYEMAESQWRQLTFDGGAYPIWTPDGTAITFLRDGELWQAASDFSGEPEALPGTSGATGASAWSSDGTLLYMTGNEIRAFSLEAGDAGAGASLPPGGNATAVFMASFSPDGQWVAYTELTDDTDVYVSPYPFSAGGRRRITTSTRGEHPRWSRDGRELFVSTSEGLVAYAMTTEPTLAWSNPKLAFPWPGGAFLPLAGPDGTRGGYDVSPDGQQVVGIVASGEEEAAADSVRIVMNWFDDLERLVPVD